VYQTNFLPFIHDFLIEENFSFLASTMATIFVNDHQGTNIPSPFLYHTLESKNLITSFSINIWIQADL